MHFFTSLSVLIDRHGWDDKTYFSKTEDKANMKNARKVPRIALGME